jgi:amino acid transporter
MSPGDVVSTSQAGDGTCPVEVAGTLQGKLGWWYLFAMSVSSILGPWVVMSWFWYSITGPSIALAFVIVGLICIPIGLVYGELSSMFPKTGGSFLFIKHGLGKEISYWIAWCLLLSYLALMSYMMYQFASIISIMWVPLDPIGIMVLAVFMTIATFILTWRAVNISAGVQFFLFAFTLIAGLLYLVLFVFSADFNPGVNWNPYFAFGNDGFLSGVGLMVTMYFGFELIPQFAEECDYPHKKHWKVMMFSVICAMLIYVSISLIETAVRPMSALLDPTGPYGSVRKHCDIDRLRHWFLAWSFKGHVFDGARGRHAIHVYKNQQAPPAICLQHNNRGNNDIPHDLLLCCRDELDIRIVYFDGHRRRDSLYLHLHCLC